MSLQPNNRETEPLLREFVLASVVMIIAGIMYLILSWAGVSFALDILTIGIGLFAGILIQSAFNFYRRSMAPEDVIYPLKKDGANSYLSFRLPRLYSQKWLEIERSLRDLSAKMFNDSNGKEPLSLQLTRLTKENILTPEEKQKVIHLLKIRNQIVYGTSDIRKSDLQRTLVEAEKVHAKIKAQVTSAGD